MKKIYLLCSAMLLVAGCTQEKPKEKLDGEALLTQKCSSCHNLDMPPKSYDNEVAPSMMAVTFHMKDFIKSYNPAEHEAKIVSFVQDYVMEPTRKKSLCDKASLDSYGLMPSQKGKVSDDELEAIVHYIYAHYDNQILLKLMAEENRLKAMLPYQRVMEQQRCNNCHDIEKDKVAPSFQMIANRYDSKDREMLLRSIKEGSRGKWKNKKLPMPPFKNMSDKDREAMVDWILSLKEKKNGI